MWDGEGDRMTGDNKEVVMVVSAIVGAIAAVIISVVVVIGGIQATSRHSMEIEFAKVGLQQCTVQGRPGLAWTYNCD